MKRYFISKSKFIVCFFILISLAVRYSERGFCSDIKKASVRAAFYPNERYVPLVIAQEKGFFAEEGIEIKINPGKGSTISSKLVANKTDDFGICSGYTALISRTKKMPLVVLAVLVQRSPVGLVYLKDCGIKKPKDLEGKTVITDFNSTKHKQFEAFLEKNGVDKDQVKMIPMSKSYVEMMIEGRGDAAVYFSHRKSTYEMKLRVELEDMVFEDFGIHVYSHSIIAHEDTVRNNPELCRAFVRGTIRGWEYAMANPEESVDAFIELYPETNREQILLKLKGYENFIKSKDTKKKGFGYHTKKGWLQTQKILLQAGIIENKIKLKKLFRNDLR